MPTASTGMAQQVATTTTTTTSMPVPRMESRQSRLDAAIALFRSEASASGYVVEEVRLRLPVPDVDVMPRVIIAQHNNGAATPPPFPRTKQHRAMVSYPYGNGHDRVAIRRGEHTFPTTSNGVNFTVPPKPVANAVDSYAKEKGESNGGVKRTVSGSVIFHPIQPKTGPSLQGSQVRSTLPHPDRRVESSSSAAKPNGDVENYHSNGVENGQVNGKYWKTVVGGDKGKAILKAAESMQKMRYGVFASKSTDESRGERQSPVEAAATPARTSTKADDEADAERHSSPTKKRKSDASPSENVADADDTGETTLHINGHSIPESHVQLLLSSAADISAREEERKRSSGSSADHISVPAEDRRARNNVPRSAASRSRPPSNGRHASSRSRKESTDRSVSRSSAARPFKCSRCPSSFDRDGHLRVHILAVHEKKRPFVCQVCDASFGHSSSLLRHVRTVHQASPAIGSGKSGSRSGPRSSDSRSGRSDENDEDNIDDSEKHFRCSVCSQAFDRVALLNRHVANKHPLKSD